MSALYLMHVDWGWAKQRPHFIAEQLASYVSIKVRFPLSYISKTINRSPVPANLDVKKLFRLPLSRVKFVSRVNDLTMKIQLALPALRSDIIWITHPGIYGLVKGYVSSRTILIYDCMDDALEFPGAQNDKLVRDKLSAEESELYHRSDIVFCSSSYLKQKLQDRYRADAKTIVVNNGIQLNSGALPSSPADVRDISESMSSLAELGGTKVVYIGTISEWFDFEIVIRSLETFSELSFVLVGPCEVEPPVHERLFLVPPVEHRHVSAIMRWADALVMPFQLTELIRSVNPVKVYEYMHAGKPTIILGYGETEVFSPYVHLYRTEDEFLSLMGRVASHGIGAKADAESTKRFLEESTWAVRARSMVESIRALSPLGAQVIRREPSETSSS